MHAYLITGPDRESRDKTTAVLLKELAIPPYAQIPLQPPEDRVTIGIAETRNWISLLSISQPNGGLKAGIIRQAETMTQEAQNAMLKTLEEPPPHTVIILDTGTPDALLPTVRSRCVSDRHTQSNSGFYEKQNSPEPPPELTDSTIPFGKWMLYVDKEIKSRDDAVLFVDQTLVWCYLRIRETPDPQIAALSDKLHTAKKNLLGNANYRLVMDRIRVGRLPAGQAEIS